MPTLPAQNLAKAAEKPSAPKSEKDTPSKRETLPQKNEEPKKSETKKAETQQPAPKEAPKSLMQVASAPDNQNSKDAEYEKDFVDVDEDAEDDDQPKVAVI